MIRRSDVSSPGRMVRLAGCCLGLWLAPANHILAQEEVKWEVAKEIYTLDFANPATAARPTFLPEGFAYEVPLNFVMFKRAKVTIQAKFPEAGRFDVAQTNPAARVEVKQISTAAQEAKFEVTLRIEPLSFEDVKRRGADVALKALDEFRQKVREEIANEEKKDKRDKQYRESYLRKNKVRVPEQEPAIHDLYEKVRTAELGVALIRTRLKELADKRPEWFSAEDQVPWANTPGWDLLSTYADLLAFDLADEHLKRWGLTYEPTRRTYTSLIRTKLIGLHAAVTGNAGGGKDSEVGKAVRALGPKDLEKIRNWLTVTTACRFYPTTDPDDPNSQWFNAQRVMCQARGIATIRVEGQLDPAHHDRSDWWTLVEFDPATAAIDLPQDPGLRCELFPQEQNRQHLRIGARGDGPVTYSFRIRPRVAPPGGRPVVVHESPSLVGVKFPF